MQFVRSDNLPTILFITGFWLLLLFVLSIIFVRERSHSIGDEIALCQSMDFVSRIQNNCPVELTSERYDNATFVFFGNSHVRNTYRCFADKISHGASWENCTDTRHCLSCWNSFPVHRKDYSYQSPDGAKLLFYWVVNWGAANDEDVDRGSHYFNDRPGLDVLSDVLQGMDLDSTYIVWNYYLQHNKDPSVLLELIRRVKASRISLKHVIFLVDPTATSKADQTIQKFKEAGITVLDMRPEFQELKQDGEQVFRGQHLTSQALELVADAVFKSFE